MVLYNFIIAEFFFKRSLVQSLCKFHLLFSRNEHIATLKKLVNAYFLRYLLTSKWIINLGHFDITFFPKDSTYTYSFSTSFSSLRRIKFESTIQRSTQLTHGVLYFFFNCKKIEFRLFPFCFEKYELFETGWNWTEFNDYPPVFYHCRGS